jgi:hypothetical protein
MARSVMAGAGHEAHDHAATVCEQFGSPYALTRRHIAEYSRIARVGYLIGFRCPSGQLCLSFPSWSESPGTATRCRAVVVHASRSTRGQVDGLGVVCCDCGAPGFRLLVSADQAKAVVRGKEYTGQGLRCAFDRQHRGSLDPEPVQIAEPIEPGPEQRRPVVDVLFGSPVVRLVGGSTQRSPFA